MATDVKPGEWALVVEELGKVRIIAGGFVTEQQCKDYGQMHFPSIVLIKRHGQVENPI